MKRKLLLITYKVLSWGMPVGVLLYRAYVTLFNR